MAGLACRLVRKVAELRYANPTAMLRYYIPGMSWVIAPTGYANAWGSLIRGLLHALCGQIFRFDVSRF
jgi:hypothetical protein